MLKSFYWQDFLERRLYFQKKEMQKRGQILLLREIVWLIIAVFVFAILIPWITGAAKGTLWQTQLLTKGTSLLIDFTSKNSTVEIHFPIKLELTDKTVKALLDKVTYSYSFTNPVIASVERINESLTEVKVK